MPEVDGFEATATLRREGWTGPILALSANTMPEARSRALAAGCDDYATKPIKGPDLLQACQTLLDRPDAQSQAA